jgi:hypothetical protein
MLTVMTLTSLPSTHFLQMASFDGAEEDEATLSSPPLLLRHHLDDDDGLSFLPSSLLFFLSPAASASAAILEMMAEESASTGTPGAGEKGESEPEAESAVAPSARTGTFRCSPHLSCRFVSGETSTTR